MASAKQLRLLSTTTQKQMLGEKGAKERVSELDCICGKAYPGIIPLNKNDVVSIFVPCR